MGNLQKSIVIGTTLLAVGVVFIYLNSQDSGEGSLSKRADTSQLAQVLKQDREMLNSETATKQQKITAMGRLGMAHDKDAYPVILENLESDNIEVRAAALQAAGFYSDGDVFDYLKEALSDSEEKIRVAALIGLSRKSGGRTAEAILSHLQGQSNYSRNEQYHSWLAYVKTETNADKRKRGYDGLVALGRFLDEAAISAMRLAPEREDVQQLAIDKLSSTNNPAVLSIALSVSARNSVEPILDYLYKYREHSDRTVRMTVMDIVSRHCPEEGPEILEKAAAVDAESALVQEKSEKIMSKCGYTQTYLEEEE